MDRLLAPHPGDADQGIHPASPRPRVVCDDRDDPADAAHPVRLCDQHHAAQSADRRAAAGAQRSRPLGPEGAAEHPLFQGDASGRGRGRVRPAAGVRHRAVRRRNSARLRTRDPARRQAGAAGRGRCHRSGGVGLGARRARAAGPHRLAERSRAAGCRPAAVRIPHPCALQSGGRDRAQHRAGPGRHHPDHDHADLHRACR